MKIREAKVSEVNTFMRGVIFAVAAGVCWGFSGTVGQFLFSRENVDPEALTVVRLISAGIILIAVSFAKDKKATLSVFREKSDILRLLIFSVLGLMMVQLSYMKAIAYSNSGTATAIQYLGEPMILLVTCLTQKRKPRKSEALGLLLALTAIVLLCTHGKIGTLALSDGAIVWGLISAASLAAYTMLPTKLISRFGSTAVTGFGMLIGGVVLFFVTGFWKTEFSLSITGVLLVIIIISVGTCLAFTLFLRSATDIGAPKAGLLAATETLAAPLFAAVWLHTSFTTADICGFVLMFAMVICLSVRPKNPQAS